MKELRKIIRSILVEWLEESSPSESEELAELLDSEDYESITRAISQGEKLRYLEVRKTNVWDSGMHVWVLDLNEELYKSVLKRQHRETTGRNMEVGYYTVTVKAENPDSFRKG